MTTPDPGVTTGAFAGTLTPAQVAQVINELVTGAPFSNSLTRAPTSTGRLALTSAAPSGFAWLEELQEVPDLALGDKAKIVAVCKIAGLLPVSSEMRADSSVNITGWISNLLHESLSRDLDNGVLRGTGAPQPDGIIDQADEVTGPTLTAAAGVAIAAIGEAGGGPNTVALSPTAYAAELTATDTAGRPIHPDGLDTIAGLRIVQVPGLATPLVFDSARTLLVVGHDSQVTLHDDPRHDAVMVLVKARVNVGMAVKGKTIRKLAITADPGTRAASAKK